MKQYAVAVISFFDNELKLEIIIATTARDAVLGHSVLDKAELKEWLDAMPDPETEHLAFGQFFFDTDMMAAVKEIEQ